MSRTFVRARPIWPKFGNRRARSPLCERRIIDRRIDRPEERESGLTTGDKGGGPEQDGSSDVRQGGHTERWEGSRGGGYTVARSASRVSGEVCLCAYDANHPGDNRNSIYKDGVLQRPVLAGGIWYSKATEPLLDTRRGK